MKTLLISCLFIILAAPQAFACMDKGIAEENDLWIGPNAKTTSQMTEQEFNQIIDKLDRLYSPIVSEKGGTLSIAKKWEDGTVNAYAQRFWKFWRVTMFGGLARYPGMTNDGFAAVVCHELGHHLAGTPNRSWASVEGQSDYFATLKCMRRYFEGDDNEAIVAKMDIPEVVTQKCQERFAGREEMAICKRNAMAGFVLADVLRKLKKLTTPVDFTTPDPSVVDTTDSAHPAPQCRLDTYFAGTLCDKDHRDDITRGSGQCTRSRGDEEGLRPLCWFKPSA